MNAYDISRDLMMSNPYDEVIITDGENTYELQRVHVDNGFVEININRRDEKNE